MKYAWFFWFLLAIVFAIIEVVNVSFFIIWFGVGALFAMLTSIFIPNLTIQFLIFIIISTILLFLTRKLTARFTKGEITHTNINSVIGRTGVVTEDILPFSKPGLVKVSGEIWSAISVDNQPILKSETVHVIKVEGVKLVVKKQ